MLKLLAIMFFLAAFPSWAAKPKACFTKTEHVNEGLIRFAIRLREFAWRCDEKEFAAGTMEPWQKLKEKFATNFTKLTSDRKKTFEREFPDTHKTIIAAWDGRIVMHYRHFPLNKILCSETKDQLGGFVKKPSWENFKKQAAKQKPEVLTDYKICLGK